MPRVFTGIEAVIRVSISLAALLVKVTAKISSGETCSCCISQAIRVVNTRVLPEPAPAKINADSAGKFTAAFCWGFNFSRKLTMALHFVSFFRIGYFSNECAKSSTFSFTRGASFVLD